MSDVVTNHRLSDRSARAVRARVLSSELEQASGPEHRRSVTYVRALIAAALGERDYALQLLRDAFAERWSTGPIYIGFLIFRHAAWL